MMCNEEDLFVVLRLMCLLSLTQGGVPKKYFDALRKEILHSYGHEYMLMLSKLQDAGVHSFSHPTHMNDLCTRCHALCLACSANVTGACCTVQVSW